MIAYLAVLAVRLISGPLFMLSLIIMLGPVDLAFPPLAAYTAWAFYALYGLALLTRRRTGSWPGHVFLVLSHPFYWMATLVPQINALWRMARGDLSWLKSPHRAYARTSDRPDASDAGNNSTPAAEL